MRPKVDGNKPGNWNVADDDSGLFVEQEPLRLKYASKILAALSNKIDRHSMETLTEHALDLTDMLIRKHNETMEEEE